MKYIHNSKDGMHVYNKLLFFWLLDKQLIVKLQK